MIYRLPLLAIALLLAAFSGCRSYRPLLGPPGTIEQQRLSASLHDPYADNDAGPEVVGGRPRGFQKPLAEPVRNRSLLEHWLGR